MADGQEAQLHAAHQTAADLRAVMAADGAHAWEDQARRRDVAYRIACPA